MSRTLAGGLRPLAVRLVGLEGRERRLRVSRTEGETRAWGEIGSLDFPSDQGGDGGVLSRRQEKEWLGRIARLVAGRAPAWPLPVSWNDGGRSSVPTDWEHRAR